jgi:hypothetical protein
VELWRASRLCSGLWRAGHNLILVRLVAARGRGNHKRIMKGQQRKNARPGCRERGPGKPVNISERQRRVRTNRTALSLPGHFCPPQLLLTLRTITEGLTPPSLFRLVRERGRRRPAKASGLPSTPSFISPSNGLLSRLPGGRRKRVALREPAETMKLGVLGNVLDRNKSGIDSLLIIIAVSFPYAFCKAPLRSSFAYTFFRNKRFCLIPSLQLSCLLVALLLIRAFKCT